MLVWLHFSLHEGIDGYIVTSVLPFCFMVATWETEEGNMSSLGIFVNHCLLKSNLKLNVKIQSYYCLVTQFSLLITKAKLKKN